MNPIIFLLIADVLMAVCGQLLLKKGMTILGPIDFNLNNIWVLIISALKNIYIWIAVICYVLGLVFWLFILSKVKLSVAYPITALVYVLVVFSSWLLLKEEIGVYQIVGTGLIVFGLLFMFKFL